MKIKPSKQVDLYCFLLRGLGNQRLSVRTSLDIDKNIATLEPTFKTFSKKVEEANEELKKTLGKEKLDIMEMYKVERSVMEEFENLEEEEVDLKMLNLHSEFKLEISREELKEFSYIIVQQAELSF
jgi:uncharacterized protein YfbU (UPF0304 family)